MKPKERKLYNEQRKNDFLECKVADSLHPSYISIFSMFTATETKLEKDLCELSLKDVQRVLDKEINSTKNSSFTFYKSCLTKYVEWCKENNYPVTDSVFKADYSPTVDRIRFRMVASPLHLQKRLDEYLEPVEEESSDCILRCFIWLAFSGLKKEEAILVKTEDVDLVNFRIYFDNRSYPIYSEAIPVFRVVCNATHFKYTNPNYASHLKVQMRERCSSEYLLRGIKTAAPTAASLCNYINKKNDKSNWFVYDGIRMSGVFYRAYEDERCGIKDVIDSIVMKEKVGLGAGKKHDKNYQKLFNNQKSRVRADYNDWKNAFSS